LQAIGSCAAGVVAMAMVRDLFPLKDNARIFSLLMLVMGASPMIGPTLGGFISATFNWRAIFIALFILSSLLMLAVMMLIPESGRADPTHSLKISNIFRQFTTVLRVPQFITYAIGGRIALSGMLAFIASSPAIFMDGYGISNKSYGWIFALETIGFIGLSQFNRVFERYFQTEQIAIRAVAGMAAGSGLLLCGSLLRWFGLIETGVLIFFILGCIGILNPNAAALSMAPFENNAGTAASLTERSSGVLPD
jgi:DHA1 family bicyclomycin/chloramphenicol resistance-like MFS transporter